MNFKSKASWVVIAVFMIFFVFIVNNGLTVPQPGDENAYYYMAKLVSEGKVPYRDFFYAHPPPHIYLLAPVYMMFGFNIVILKGIPLISALVTAFFVFRISREKFGDNEAVLSALLFLFSYSVMFNSVFSFGIMVAAMFLTAGYYFLTVRNNYAAAGLLFGIAGLTRLLALVPAAVALLFMFVSGRRKFFRLSSSFLAIFLVVNLAFLFYTGSAYTDSVYKYHLLKSPGGENNLKEYSGIIKLNWTLFLSTGLLVFAKDRKKAGIFAASSVFYLISLLFLKKFFGFYVILVFPLMAVIGGYAVAGIFRRLNIGRNIKFAAAAIIILIFSWNLAADISFMHKIGFKGFERGGDLAQFIKSNSGQNTELFGDGSVVPLLALATEKKIVFDLVDTNDQVFSSGLLDLEVILEKIGEKDVLFIVRSTQGISVFPETRNFLNKKCEFLSQFNDNKEGDYLVFRC